MIILEKFVQYTSIDSLPKGALVTAVVAITIFVLTKVIEFIGRINSIRANRKRIVKALYKEIQDNIVTIQKFTDDFAYVYQLRERVRSTPKLIPLLVIDETSQFYDALGPALVEIRSDCLISVSKFYSYLREQRQIVEAINRPAFLTISNNGRANMINNIWNSARFAEREGRIALYELRLSYPKRWFKDFMSRS